MRPVKLRYPLGRNPWIYWEKKAFDRTYPRGMKEGRDAKMAREKTLKIGQNYLQNTGLKAVLNTGIFK